MRVKSLIIVGMLAASGVAAPLSAEASLSQCLTNKMCVWGNNDFEWLLAAQIHNQGSWLDVFNNGTGENDQNDSWANRSASYTGCMADDVDGGGQRLGMARNSKDNDMAFFNSNFVSAMRTKNGC